MFSYITQVDVIGYILKEICILLEVERGDLSGSINRKSPKNMIKNVFPLTEEIIADLVK